MDLGAEARWSGRIAIERSYTRALLQGAHADGVGPSLFLDPDLRQVVHVISELRRSGRPVDETIVLDVLRNSGAAACGKDWSLVLAMIWDAPAVPSNADEYVRLIAAYAGVDRLRMTLGEIIRDIDSPAGCSDPAGTLEAAQSAFTKALIPAPKPHPLIAVSGAEILAAATRPLEWTVQPLLTKKGIRIISGPGKVTKTTFLMAMMVRAITEGTLAGHFRSDGGHRVIWFDAENSMSSWSRKYVAVCQGLGIDPLDLIDSGRFVYFQSCGLYLDQPGTLSAVIDATKRAKATEAVFDSLTRVHRQKESDAVSMSSFFVDAFFRLRDEANVGITIPHHTRKGQRGVFDDPADSLRGTSDLRNVCDTHLALSREKKDPKIFTLEVTAQRDAPEEGPFSWRMEWTPGSPTFFLPFQSSDPSAKAPTQGGRPPKTLQRAKRLLREARVSNPNLRRVDGIGLCKKANIGTTTAKKAWNEIRGA